MKHICIFVLFLYAFSFFGKAQKMGVKSNNDLSFINDKIVNVYAGYDSIRHSKAINKIFKEISTQKINDTFIKYSNLTDYFSDQHLALFEARPTRKIDTNQSRNNFERIKRYSLNQPVYKYEGFWINDVNNLIIYIKFNGMGLYSAYLFESKKKIPRGYKIIDFYKRNKNYFKVDYIDPVFEYRTLSSAYFKSDSILYIKPYSKWHKVNGYYEGLLKAKTEFDDAPAIFSSDSNTVLVKMHDFSTRGIRNIYDSLIKANSNLLVNCRHLVIDLRYNLGGTINSIIPLLGFFCDTPVITVGGYQRVSKDLIDDAFGDREFYNKRNDTNKVRSLDSLIAEFKKSENKSIYIKPDTLRFKKIESKIKHVSVLINYASRSAAELVVLYLMQQKLVKTFGEETGGAVDYLDMLSYNLPVSKYVLWVATVKRELKKNQPAFDKTGISPDIELSPFSKDWLFDIKKYYGY